MKATVWIALIALTLTVFVAAQTEKPAGGQSDPYATPTAKPQQAAAAESTQTGCLAAPVKEKGNYTLQTESGNIELVASKAIKADDLKAHVGHSVEVSGKQKSGGAFEVSKITMKAETCAAPAMK